MIHSPEQKQKKSQSPNFIRGDNPKSKIQNPKSNHTDYTHQLQQLMQQVGISSFKALSKSAGVSERQIKHLRLGKISQMRVEILLKISQALQISLTELLVNFGIVRDSQLDIKQEYQRLQAQIEQQRETLKQEFQQSSLQILEPWLLQWPTAAYATEQNPQLPAVKLLPLVRPVQKLIQEWGVEAIASVGAEVEYDPQWHQLMEGTAQKGDRVKVRYLGYRQADKLLYRAKVNPIEG